MKLGTTSLVAMVKNEGPYLWAWVAHHNSIGFDNIVIFQNLLIEEHTQSSANRVWTLETNNELPFQSYAKRVTAPRRRRLNILDQLLFRHTLHNGSGRIGEGSSAADIWHVSKRENGGDCALRLMFGLAFASICSCSSAACGGTAAGALIACGLYGGLTGQWIIGNRQIHGLKPFDFIA